MLDIELQENVVYKPKTKENRILYENLLSKIFKQLGDEPQENIRSAADEVLAVLKSDHLKDTDKKRDIEVAQSTTTIYHKPFNLLLGHFANQD